MTGLVRVSVASGQAVNSGTLWVASRTESVVSKSDGLGATEVKNIQVPTFNEVTTAANKRPI